jgi:hypothetical protein
VQWFLPVATRALWLAATIDMPKFPIRSIFTELGGNEVSFTAVVLAAVDGCTAGILKEVEGQCAWIGICVTGDGTRVLL